jgi:hypothetical protein
MWNSDPNFGVVLIVAIVFSSVAIVPIMIGILIVNNLRKKREFELIRVAIEKGMPVPDFTEQTSRYGTLKAALIWIAIGLGFMLMVAFSSDGNGEALSLGFIPILIGLALCISWYLESRYQDREKAKPRATLDPRQVG